MNTEKILSRLSIPGILLLMIGCAVTLSASRFSRMPALLMRIFGLLAAVFGALILLDFIPGL